MNKNDDWSKVKKRLVLYLDIMGFKEKVARTHPGILRKELIEFCKKWKARIKPLTNNEHIKYAQFSDSIIVAADGASQKQLNLITRTAIIIMQEALKIGFPMKGALSCGMFSFDEASELYFGQPLVDAFLLEEKVFYYGIVVHDTAEGIVKRWPLCNKFYSKIEISLKDGEVNHYQINWNMMDNKNDTKDITNTAFDWLDKIEEHVSGRPRVYVQHTRSMLSTIHEMQIKPDAQINIK